MREAIPLGKIRIAAAKEMDQKRQQINKDCDSGIEPCKQLLKGAREILKQHDDAQSKLQLLLANVGTSWPVASAKFRDYLDHEIDANAMKAGDDRRVPRSVSETVSSLEKRIANMQNRALKNAKTPAAASDPDITRKANEFSSNIGDILSRFASAGSAFGATGDKLEKSLEEEAKLRAQLRTLDEHRVEFKIKAVSLIEQGADKKQIMSNLNSLDSLIQTKEAELAALHASNDAELKALASGASGAARTIQACTHCNLAVSHNVGACESKKKRETTAVNQAVHLADAAFLRLNDKPKQAAHAPPPTWEEETKGETRALEEWRQYTIRAETCVRLVDDAAKAVGDWNARWRGPPMIHDTSALKADAQNAITHADTRVRDIRRRIVELQQLVQGEEDRIAAAERDLDEVETTRAKLTQQEPSETACEAAVARCAALEGKHSARLDARATVVHAVAERVTEADELAVGGEHVQGRGVVEHVVEL